MAKLKRPRSLSTKYTDEEYTKLTRAAELMGMDKATLIRYALNQLYTYNDQLAELRNS